MSFEGLLGNERLKENLRMSVGRGRISHFYLISGPAGSGKRTLAKLLSAAILCQGESKPCLSCNACRKVMGDAHPEIPGGFAKDCFRGAPVMTFIARDLSYDFSPYDCGLLAENIMLSAWSMGVGSICLGSPVRFLTDNDLCKPYLEKLGFSEGYELCLCVGLGYANEEPEVKSRDAGKVKFID